MKKKKEKAFTLIELLAVIIILGILMIIAIPSVTSYISTSRKSAYIDTARQVIASTRNLVNSGKLSMFDRSATYYIPTSCIKLENSNTPVSPYGDFERAYIVVTYEGSNYNYYWVSVDETGQGISTLTKVDDLDEDLIKTGLKGSDIVLENISGKNRLVEFTADCKNTINHVDDAGSDAANTTDNITWTYNDMSISVDVHLSQCNISGDYKICYNATIDASNVGENATIKYFEAIFDIPQGTELVHQGYDPDKLKAEIVDGKLKIIGNSGQNTWNFLTPSNGSSHLSGGFQIKFPKDVDFVLQNGKIQYVELVSGVQEGNSSGVQGNASDMNIDLAKLNIRLVRDNYYNSGNGKYTAQYTVYVKNISDSDITDWSFVLEAPDTITNISSYNPLIYSKSGNVYTFTPFEWDNEYRTLSPNETAHYDKKLVIETTDMNAMPTIR